MMVSSSNKRTGGRSCLRRTNRAWWANFSLPPANRDGTQMALADSETSTPESSWTTFNLVAARRSGLALDM